MAAPLTTVASRRVLYMRFKTLALVALSATAAFAQNIAGTWQGTLQTPQRALRLVMKVTRADDESLKAMFYSIDQNGQGIPGSAVSLQGTAFKATIPAIGGSYEGKLSADGTTHQRDVHPGRAAAAEPGEGDAVDGMGDPRAAASAAADGRGREADVRSRDHQAEQSGHARAGNQRRAGRWECVHHAEYAALRADQIRLCEFMASR